MVVLSFSVIVVNCLVREGQANYLEDVLLVGTYFIVAMPFYVHSGDAQVLAGKVDSYQ